mgnify:CR=1 FL=1
MSYVLLLYTFGLTHWAANCFPAEPWIGLTEKPFIGGMELHCYIDYAVCNFCRIMAFLQQKCRMHGEEIVPSKKKHHI